MKIICTLNLKGGCAKTTTAVSMAELLATGFKSKHERLSLGKSFYLTMTSKGTQAAYLMRTREKQKARRQQY